MCPHRAILLSRKAFVCCGEQSFFFTCWQLTLCQSPQLWISQRWRLADQPILGNEYCALLTLSPVSTFHIQYYTNAEHLHSHHISSCCLLQLPPWQHFFPLSTPIAEKVAPGSSQQDRKSLSRLFASAFFALEYTVNAERTDRKKGEKDRGVVWGLRGFTVPTGQTNLGV